jgi:hypothetical protein
LIGVKFHTISRQWREISRHFTPFPASGVKFHANGVNWRTHFTPSYFPPEGRLFFRLK